MSVKSALWFRWHYTTDAFLPPVLTALGSGNLVSSESHCAMQPNSIRRYTLKIALSSTIFFHIFQYQAPRAFCPKCYMRYCEKPIRKIWFKTLPVVKYTPKMVKTKGSLLSYYIFLSCNMCFMHTGFFSAFNLLFSLSCTLI